MKEELDSALNERPRPGQKRKLDGRREAHLIAIVCSDAPQGHADWTIQLLADKVVAMGFAESIFLETVRQVLKKRTQAVEGEGVVHPRGGGEFVARMEDVLDLYHQDYDPDQIEVPDPEVHGLTLHDGEIWLCCATTRRVCTIPLPT